MRRPNGFPRKALNVEVRPETYAKLHQLAGEWGIGLFLDIAVRDVLWKGLQDKQKAEEMFKTSDSENVPRGVYTKSQTS